MSVQVEYKVDNIVDLNDDLAKGTLYVAYTGDNRNGSVIEQSGFEAAIPTLSYKPVVAHYLDYKDDFGGHDGEVEETDDGDVVYVNLTEPVGVVPENTAWRFETLSDAGGVHNYFVIDVILWKRQKSYDVICKKKFTKQSMEIEVLDGYSDSDGYHIVEFKFLAFCLLGDDVEPCFEGARLELFSMDKVRAEFELFMETLRNYGTQLPLAVEQPTGNGEHIENQRKEESGTLNKVELFTKIGYDPESLGLDLESMSDEEVTAKVFELTSNLIDQIRDCMAEQTFETEWGKIRRYWMVDTDLEAKMVYCYDEQDMKLYGFSYSLSGDIVSVDWDSKKRMKYSIVALEEGEEASGLAFVRDCADARGAAAQERYSELETKLQDAEASKKDLGEQVAALFDQNSAFAADKAIAESKVEELNGEVERLNSVVADLESFKASVEKSAADAEKEALFTKWESLLSNVEAFGELRTQAEEFELAELETKLKCLFADTKANFEHKSVSKPSTRLPLGNSGSGTETGDYGGLYEKYGVKPVK